MFNPLATPEGIQQAWNGLISLIKNRQASMSPAVGKFSVDMWIMIIRKELLIEYEWGRSVLLKVDYGYKDTLTDHFIHDLCDGVKAQLKRYPL